MTTSGAIKREKDDLSVGTEIGRYRVEEPVGRGDYGIHAPFRFLGYTLLARQAD